jgi:hypothetical protein
MAPPRPLERRRLLVFDRVIKAGAWQRALVLAPKRDVEASSLLAFAPLLRMTLVWDPAPALGSPVIERVRQEAVLARLRTTVRVNPRLEVLQQPVMAALTDLRHDLVRGVREPFSGAILLEVAEDGLAALLPLVAALVRPGGMLMGIHLNRPAVRSALARVAPGWLGIRDEVWRVPAGNIRGMEPQPAIPQRPTIPQPNSVPQAASNHAQAARHATGEAGDPDETASSEQGAPSEQRGRVHLPAGEAGAPDGGEPLSGCSLRRKRTRPTWETLERNLGPYPVAPPSPARLPAGQLKRSA